MRKGLAVPERLADLVLLFVSEIAFLHESWGAPLAKASGRLRAHRGVVPTAGFTAVGVAAFSFLKRDIVTIRRSRNFSNHLLLHSSSGCG